MCNINQLKEQIEQTRTKMYKTYEKNPVDPEIITISKELDVLLNKYNSLLKNKKKSN